LDIASATVTVTVPPQLSVAFTAVILDCGTAEAQLTVKFCGVPVMTGGVWSFTVMVCDDVELLPHTSVAVHVLVIVNMLVQALIWLSHHATVTVTVPAQLSVALTAVLLD
jgi:hypothetical protein